LANSIHSVVLAQLAFVLGRLSEAPESQAIEQLAAFITSPLSQRLLTTFTEGSLRYRLNFIAKGHQRSVVRLAANRALPLARKFSMTRVTLPGP